MKYKKEDKIIQDLISFDISTLELSNDKLIEFLDYIIAWKQLFILFPIPHSYGYLYPKSVKKSVLESISVFIEGLNDYFETYDCEDYINFMHKFLSLTHPQSPPPNKLT